MKHVVNLPEIAAYAALIAELAEGDEQTFLDTLDGETDAIDVLRHLVQARIEAEAYEAASKEAAATFTARARRMADRKASINRVMGEILDATGQQKLAFDTATVSRTKPRVSCEVSDPALIPSQLCKQVPDKTAIKKQLEAGEYVPGAHLDAGQPGLTVRVK